MVMFDDDGLPFNDLGYNPEMSYEEYMSNLEQEMWEEHCEDMYSEITEEEYNEIFNNN